MAVDTGTSELAGGVSKYLWKFQISRFGVLFEVLLKSSTSWSSAEPNIP